jgi:probable F420-dependent oxidoreductase
MVSDRCGREDGRMIEHRFRFGVVAGTAKTASDWTDIARHAEDRGFGSLLVPDTRGTLSPFAALAAAATVTGTLRVGTYVLSVANRTPGLVVWETSSLDRLSGGRFELGLGGGRPDAARDAEALGVPFGTPADRLARVAATIDAVTAEWAGPVLVAASGPRMLRLAAERADTIALGLPPGAPYERLVETVERVREYAGDRFDDLELHLNLAGVAASPDLLPEWMSRMVGGDPRAMAAAGGIGFLTGTTGEIVDALRRRRDELGISYVAVSAMFADRMAPIVEQLAGS